MGKTGIATKANKSAQQTEQAPPKAKAPDQANASQPVAASQDATSWEKVDHDPNDIMEALRKMHAEFSKKFQDVMTGISGIQTEIQNQNARITEAEERIGKTEDDVNAINTTIKMLQEKRDKLEAKVEDQENRARRNNLRLIGLPEKAEGGDMCAFLEGWLPGALGTDTFLTPPIIERAHWIGRPPTGRDPRPRAVIMKFLNYKDKELAARAARLKKTVQYKNQNVRFYPDYSAETHRQQRLFDPVKKQLQIMGLRYGMFYPATLMVTRNGQQHFFKSAREAEAIVGRWQQDSSSTPATHDGTDE